MKRLARLRFSYREATQEMGRRSLVVEALEFYLGHGLGHLDKSSPVRPAGHEQVDSLRHEKVPQVDDECLLCPPLRGDDRVVCCVDGQDQMPPHLAKRLARTSQHLPEALPKQHVRLRTAKEQKRCAAPQC